jgi:DNA-binding XRE family transcriptional regulator
MITYQKKLQYISEQSDNPPYRQLAQLLETNHVTIQNILKGIVQLPSLKLRKNIDELFHNYKIVMEITQLFSLLV